VLVTVLVVGGIAAAVYFREPGVNEQLRSIAVAGAGIYREEIRGPRWYVELANKYKLPVLRWPVKFHLQTATDEDMKVVGRANTLREIWLNSPKISDAGLVLVKKFKKLQLLVLNDTEVTDEGLAHLKSLKGLTTLYLQETRVTPEGIADLKSAIPNVQVHFEIPKP